MEEKNKKAAEPKKRASLSERSRAAQTSGKKRVSLKEYFKGVRLEMKKVVWPTRKETASYTGVVIVTCAIFAIIFWAFDTGFLALLKAALNITF